LKPRFDFLDQRVLLSGYQVTLNISGGGGAIAGESQQFTALAEFQATDPEGNGVTTPAGFKATIIWGDGSTSPGQIENYPGAAGLFEINGNHTYPDPSTGQYWATVTLTDPDGGQWGGYYLADVIVNPPPNNLKMSSAFVDQTLAVTVGHPIAGVIAVVTVVNAALPVTGLSGQIYDADTGGETPARIVPAGPGTWDVYDPAVFRDPGPGGISFQLVDHQGDWVQSSDQIIAQVPQGKGTEKDPLRGGVNENQENFSPGNTVKLQSGTEVHVDPGGGAPPPEAGVDWDTWYRKWINMVDTKVYQLMLDRSFAVRDTMTVSVRYTVWKDGKVDFAVGTPGGHGSKATIDRNLQDWANDARELMSELHDPLPANTKLAYIVRTFTFSKNTGKAGIKLGGPPQELGH